MRRQRGRGGVLCRIRIMRGSGGLWRRFYHPTKMMLRHDTKRCFGTTQDIQPDRRTWDEEVWATVARGTLIDDPCSRLLRDHEAHPVMLSCLLGCTAAPARAHIHTFDRALLSNEMAPVRSWPVCSWRDAVVRHAHSWKTLTCASA
jgi:hypothetical protein